MSKPAVVLPQAVLERRRRIEQQFGTAEGPPPAQEPPAQEPPAQEPPAQEPLDGDGPSFDLDSLALPDDPPPPIGETQTQTQTQTQTPAAPSVDLAPLHEDIASLRADLDALKAKPLEISVADVTPEERERFGASQPFIEKVAAAAARQMVATALQDLEPRFAALQQSIDNIQPAVQQATSLVTQNAKEAYLREVASRAPNAASLVKHKNFRDFLNRRVPTGGGTYLEAYRAATTKYDAAATINILAAFAQVVGSPLKTFDTPRPAAGSQTADLQSVRKRGKLPISERTKAWNEFRAANQPVSGPVAERWHKIRAKYEEAAQVDGIDYDA